MGLHAVDNCIITGVKAINKPSDLDAIEYSITYNGHRFSFVFQSTVYWHNVISEKTKNILTAMLYNNEWPIDSGTYITHKLIEEVLRLANYPKNFDEKLDHYLVRALNSGGDEYKSIKYNLSNYHAAYADNSEEFTRILDALEEKRYIKFTRLRTNINNTEEEFKLSETGRTKARELDKSKTIIGRLKLPANLQPGICVCYVTGDEGIGKQTEEFFSKKGFTIYNAGSTITKESGDSYIRNIRNLIYDHMLNYVIFIKSYKSDISTSFGSVVSMVIEAHINARNNMKFIYIGFADDSPHDAQPRLSDYHEQMFDLRINAQRDKLLIDVLSDLTNKINSRSSSYNPDIKIKFLKWLNTQVIITQVNPVYVRYALVKDIFSSDEELQTYLWDLKRDNLIDFTIKDNGPTIYSEYMVTVMEVAIDWVNERSKLYIKNQEKFKLQLPTIRISESEKKWLNIVYEKFLKVERFQVAHLFASYWKEFPEDFHPSKIDYRLIRGGDEITILGIWQIDQSSPVFEKLDQTIRTIRDIITARKEIKELKSQTIIDRNPELSELDVRLSIELLGQIGGFMDSLQKENAPKLGIEIQINTNSTYDKYRLYKGLEKLVQESLQPPIEVESEPEDQKTENNTSGFSTEKIYYKFPINIKDADVEPVLGAKELAGDLAEIILDIPNEQGKMVGVFGRWGRGKSFFIKELWKSLLNKANAGKKEYIKVEYQAWKYQDTPASWAYLYEILGEVFNPKPMHLYCFWAYIKYYRKIGDLNIERHGLNQILKLVFSLGFTIVTGYGFVEWGNVKKETFIPYIGIPAVALAFVALITKIKREYSTQAKELIKRYSTKQSFKESLGLQAEIQKEIVSLLKVWIPSKEVQRRKIILFVEDIDRCTEDKIIQNIDALRIIIEDPEIAKRLIIIAAIDERVLKRAVKSKYSDLVGLDCFGNEDSIKKKLDELTTEYLDKLFISGIKLGGLNESERIEFFDVLTKHDRTEEAPSNEMPWQGRQVFVSLSEADRKEAEDISKKLEYFTEWNFAMRNGEIIRKDGDIALENDYGELKTIKEISEDGTNPKKPKSSKLTNEEVGILREHLVRWENTTPRKIRIFYYRYLLVKNLLISRYKKINRDNVWQTQELCSFFVASLIRFSEEYDLDVLYQEKIRIMNKANEVSDYDELKKQNVSNKDFAELLSVLELVIAY